ncbi:TetR/AcrR family transcriptional regulator [Paracoccus spongiarum]|uniref:TetR/AcrR family transcriptional regulator n=1 Tax=Paracoccus spongiarum TaxID=3064387 RepID=A0ABT9JAJ5_9RHOB|nr:TetR/AcrR family transcriptional regulator [Paracoccus sp. 2205BS29-5]MDP5306833.1 TetR/AcrR family transcriptional regulator [Paracoccus sp. 2205BS29-5]
MENASTPTSTRGAGRDRLLSAARDLVRRQGFAATSVDQLCREAGVTKGAFFHHFASKADLGVAAAEDWAQATGAMFAAAPYHDHDDPLDRLLAYVDFRRQIIAGEIEEFTCLVGTLTQEVYHQHPRIRAACAASIFGHAATLEADIAAVMARRGLTGFSATSLAAHTQAVLQGAFILAKAADDPGLATDSVDHLKRYLVLLLQDPERRTA